MLPRTPLDLADVLAKLEAVLDKPRSSRSLEEEFQVDPGVAATETEHTKVLTGRECWSRLLHHCEHFRTSRGVVVMVAGPLDEDRIGGFERQRAMLSQICGILEYAAKDKDQDLALGSPLVGLSSRDA